MTYVKSDRIDAGTFGPLTYNGDDPVYVMESQFGMKLPENMQPEFTQVFQSMSSVADIPLKAEDVWAFFKDTYILPEESTVFYFTHQTHVFGDGTKFISVKVIENEEMQTKDGDGYTFAEAVVDAFGMTGHKVTRPHGKMINAPGYGRKICVIVGVTQEDGKTYFGAGVSEKSQTAEVMAATRACGRAMFAARSKVEASRHPG